MESWMFKLTEQIRSIVGEDKLPHYQTVVLPGIIADFHGMLMKAPANKQVEEEYFMEDGSMKILLRGTKDRSGKCRIIAAEVRQCQI